MPPTDLSCSPLTLTTESYNATRPDDINGDDLNALLYIVVTLLFYSLGIIVGIITYLKREKREMEESKTFEVFMNLKNDPFTATKLRRVQIMTAKLEQLEKVRVAKEEDRLRESERLMMERDGEESGTEDELLERELKDEDECVHESALCDISDRPVEIINEPALDNNDDSKKLQLKKQPNVFQVSPSGEAISSVVAKIFDSERRGGLPNSPKALHLFKSRGILSRDQSIDSPGRDRMNSERSSDKLTSNSVPEGIPPLAEPERYLVTNV